MNRQCEEFNALAEIKRSRKDWEEMQLVQTTAKFQQALFVKLKKKLHQGRRGWDSDEFNSEAITKALLVELENGGDPIDLAAYCMFLWMRGRAADRRIVKAFAKELPSGYVGL